MSYLTDIAIVRKGLPLFAKAIFLVAATLAGSYVACAQPLYTDVSPWVDAVIVASCLYVPWHVVTTVYLVDDSDPEFYRFTV